MGDYTDQLTRILVSTEETAESIGKLAKFLQQGVEMYSKISSTLAQKSGGKSTGSDSIYKQLAELWGHLPKDTRRDLTDEIITNVKGNDALFLEGLIGQMLSLASMLQPVAKLGVLLGKVVKNQQEILKQLTIIEERLKVIEIKLDERTMQQVRVALIHLNDAALDESQKEESLHLAYTYFSDLVGLNPDLLTNGVNNRALIALGYYGRHLVSGMRNRTRLALIQVYQCTQKYPLEGMLVFPPEYFIKDYKAEIDAATRLEITARGQEATAMQANRESKADNALEMLGGASIALLGLAAIVFTRHSGMMYQGLQAMRIGFEKFYDAGTTSPVVYDTYTPAQTARSMVATRERLTTEIVGESLARLELLTKVKVDDLRKIVGVPANKG